MSTPERPSFADVYDEHVWSVYGFFGYRVGDREAAEDLTQITFENALRSWNRYDPRRASPLTWVMAIARNVLVDHYRRDRSDRHRPIAEGEEGSGALGVEPGPELLGVSPELERALDTLPQRQRELVALRFGAELRGPEIAELVGLSLANVQQILSRALRKLRIELERPGGAEPEPEPEEEAAAPPPPDRGG
jgi:RNA polymerase sigma-70 factor (ECF subfamily)